jgi:hypothetical protein
MLVTIFTYNCSAYTYYSNSESDDFRICEGHYYVAAVYYDISLDVTDTGTYSSVGSLNTFLWNFDTRFIISTDTTL